MTGTMENGGGISEEWQKGLKLEQFIRAYIPRGWKEPIKMVDFVPFIHAVNYNKFAAAYKRGDLTETLKTNTSIICGREFCQFNKPYFIEAINKYFEENGGNL